MSDILSTRREQEKDGKARYKKFGLKSNPLPKSGTANINESSEFTKVLVPVEKRIKDQIMEFVGDSLYSPNDDDEKLICTVTGDYGTGKTQLLLYAKYLIQNEPKKSYVIYINNPGNKLSELIGSIIESIGEEQFKRYIWNQIIEYLDNNEEYKKELLNLVSNGGELFFPDSDPFSEESKATHKLFLDSFLKQIGDKTRRKVFIDNFKRILLVILQELNSNDTVIANYFYNLISEDFGVNKTWETITSGTGKYLDDKVVRLLNAIINIIKNQGFERFYLLVDEFEDITSGRLSKKEVDNYSHNLRTLIDKERRWCLLIAMTSEALKDLKRISPPLVDRLTDRKIILERLSGSHGLELIRSYLNTSRDAPNESFLPFNKEVIAYILNVSEGLPRLLLRKCYYLLERAADELNEGQEITVDFAKKYLEE